MLPVVVVTVYAPRPQHPKFVDYLPLLKAQKASAALFGHKHLVVTDADLGSEFAQVRASLQDELMPAMIEGVIAGLTGRTKQHIVFVDADCLVNKPLNGAFTGGWDVALCRRQHESSAINNGAMFVDAAGVKQAQSFFRTALGLCGTHWGADQEAISAAAAPVPGVECVEERSGAVVSFVSMKTHAAVPADTLGKHRSFIVHFKGSKKEWMLEYARRYMGIYV